MFQLRRAVSLEGAKWYYRRRRILCSNMSDMKASKTEKVVVCSCEVIILTAEECMYLLKHCRLIWYETADRYVQGLWLVIAQKFARHMSNDELDSSRSKEMRRAAAVISKAMGGVAGRKRKMVCNDFPESLPAQSLAL